MAAHSSPLVDLPDEVLHSVAEAALDDALALQALARTCRRLQRFTEAYIYRSILLRSGSQASTLADALSAQSRRANCIYTPDSRITYREDLGMASLTPWIAQMTKLRTWVVESPWCNYERSDSDPQARWQREMKSFATMFRKTVELSSPRPLSMLQSCKSSFSNCCQVKS